MHNKSMTAPYSSIIVDNGPRLLPSGSWHDDNDDDELMIMMRISYCSETHGCREPHMIDMMEVIMHGHVTQDVLTKYY